MTIKRLLIANRAEIAIRIINACTDLGITSVAIYSTIDKHCKHVVVANEAYQLNEVKQNPAVGPYLNIENIIQLCKQHKIDAVHPGYGFLSENSQFAAACEQNNIIFIGPNCQHIELLGNKINSKQVAIQCKIPVIQGSTTALKTYNDVLQCVQQIQLPVMLKSTNGGGGKGIRIVNDMNELQHAYDTCVSESKQSFGTAAIFVEQLIQKPKHIEIQILADKHNNVVSLGERDCSAQLNNQKVIEISNAPNLSQQLKQQPTADAIKICQHIKYINAATVEFLVDTVMNKYYFLEINPRVQVEHCVTEQTTNVDIVQTQIQIANGISLKQLNIQSYSNTQQSLYSIQARVNIMKAGRLTAYNVPTHKDIRIDDFAYQGYTVLPFFDSLLCKVIATAPTYKQAYTRLYNALLSMRCDGIETNINLLLNLIDTTEFHKNSVYCTYIQHHEQQLNQPNKKLRHVQSQYKAIIPTEPQQSTTQQSQHTGTVIRSSLSALVNEIRVKQNDTVYKGDIIAIVSAMKMQTTIKSPYNGRVTQIHVQPNQLVEQNAVLVTVDTDGVDQSSERATKRVDSITSQIKEIPHDNWQSQMSEIKHRQQLIKQGDPNGMQRQKAAGKLHVRERIDQLLDAQSFQELGSIAAGSTKYDKKDPNKLLSLIAANVVIGTGTINNGTKRVVVNGDDFTIRGGHSDGSIYRKSMYAEQYARDFRLPMIRLLDGSSGGGSVISLLKMGFNYVPPLYGFQGMVAMLAEIPVATALLGPVVGLGAARGMAAHFNVMVENLAQCFVAGPPLVAYTEGRKLTKDELGGPQIHGANGTIDNIASSELNAFNQIKQFLSYMPINAWQLPVPETTTDTVDRYDDRLNSIISHKRNESYDIRELIQYIVDINNNKTTWFEIGRTWGQAAVVGFARLNGYTVGILASDCNYSGGSLTAAASQKMKRHVELCNSFHIPIFNLVDMPGFAVGLEYEKQSTIKYGTSLLASLYQSTVPLYSVIVRRCFGVAGAGLVDNRDPNIRVAWPSGDWGSLPLEGGLEAAFKGMLANHPDPVKAHKELLQQFEAIRNPIRTAEAFNIEEIIEPKYTRRYACEWVELAYHKLRSMPILPVQNGYKI